MRLRLLLVLLVPLAACGPPPCSPVRVSLPEAPSTIPWSATGNGRVEAEVASTRVTALLDTGFPQSALALQAVSGVDLSRVPVRLGGMTAGPLPFGLLVDPALDIAAVLGADVLHQLPFSLDARARALELAPAFATPSSAPGVAPLGLWITGMCRDDRAEAGPEGPHAFLVEAELDGQPLRLIMDTGADATFVRQAVVAALDERPRLSGIRVATGFSGPFLATATRARTLSMGGVTSPNSLILTGDAVDAGLDRLLSRYGGRRCASGIGCPARLDGFLGWSFLREFRVSLTEGLSPTRERRLRLERFDLQDHWSRELVGVGTYTTRTVDPAGARIDGFLSVSPAREAGLREGDVILTVDGVPVESAPSPYGPPGSTVQLGIARGATRLTVPVQVRDLLPDPP